MVFSSSVFIFVFLPIVLGLYFLCPGRTVKNIWLLITSLVFYAWGEPVYVILMIVSIALNWLLAILIEKFDSSDAKRKVISIIACVVNVAIIGFYKYEGFFAENINAVAGSTLVPDLDLPLPIGISFYTLQALSYVIDVYRREVPAQRNILFLGMYVSCFPQLIAGPIVRYQTIADQIKNRHENLKDFSSGLRLFIVGLAKKVLLANTVAILAQDMLTSGGANIGAAGAWGGLIAYTFQIFFDFSGYSDMAIGLGRMMGFKYLRNFNYPYISKSITDFWRRWHISLSSFFRDYIYIPLGGSRVSKARWVFNIAVVWAITGFWHGAAWNYILWGVYYGFLLICEKLIWGNALKKAPAFIQHLYTTVIFMFGWSFFWITNMGQLQQYLLALVGAYGWTGNMTFWQIGVWSYIPVFIACIFASTPIVPWIKEHIIAYVEKRKALSTMEEGIAHYKQIEADGLCVFDAQPADKKREHIFNVASIVVDTILLVLLVLSVFSIVSGSFNPFIYFQF